VILIMSNSTIDARIGRRGGTLISRNSGAFRTVSEESIVDPQRSSVAPETS
jgi:hypothetical protein